MDVLTNHYRERMVASLMARWGSPAAVLDYAPAAERDALQSRCAVFAQDAEHEVPATARAHIEQILMSATVVRLGEVHPSWLVDRLAHESPRVVGVLLRFLPSKHARYVLEQLPQSLREQLPSVIDAFSVPDPVLRLLRQHFESQFQAAPTRLSEGELGFADVATLRPDELTTLLHDLGIDELAIALRHLPKQALRVLLGRMPFADGKVLADRMASLRVVSAGLERDARYSILEMNFERAGNSQQFIQEVGVQAFAKAMTAAELPLLGALKQKLAPALAYLLQREIDMHVPTGQEALTHLRQHRVLRRVAVLAQAHVLDGEWLQRLPLAVRQDLPENVHESPFQQAS